MTLERDNTRLIINALEYRIKRYERDLQNKNINEEEKSHFLHDKQYYTNIIQDLKMKGLAEPEFERWTSVLLPEDIRWIIYALEYRIEHYERDLQNEDVNEDEHADLTNDMLYYKAILFDIKHISRNQKNFA